MNADDLLLGAGTPREPHPEGTRPPRRCVTCQVLDSSDEPAKDRLIRYQSQVIDKLSSRLMNEGDRKRMEQRIVELEEIVERMNRRRAQ